VFIVNKFGGYGCLVSNFITLLSACGSISAALLVCRHNLIAAKSDTFTSNALDPKYWKPAVLSMWIFWIVLAGASIPAADMETYEPICVVGDSRYDWRYMCIVLSAALVNVVLVGIVQGRVILAIKLRTHFLTSQLHANIEPATTAMKLKHMKKFAKMTRIISVVLLFTILSWGPLFIGLWLRILCPTCGGTTNTIRPLGSLLFINSIVNVFIYAAKSEKFRHAFRIVLCRKPLCRPAVGPGDTTAAVGPGDAMPSAVGSGDAVGPGDALPTALGSGDAVGPGDALPTSVGSGDAVGPVDALPKAAGHGDTMLAAVGPGNAMPFTTLGNRMGSNRVEPAKMPN
jgi:hypothetical protein